MEQIKDYLQSVSKNLKDGDSRELTYRTYFQNLFQACLPKGYTMKHEPAGREEGKPDFIVFKEGTPIGIIETKDVGKKLACTKSDIDQLKRYYNSISNVILTDYLEFRWYARLEDTGKEKDEILEPRTLFHLATDLGSGKLKLDPQAEENFSKLVNHFLCAKVKTVSNPTELAQRMASIACDIRDSLLLAMKNEVKDGDLHSELEAIKKDLLHTITEEQFADMYAQTICYGLFAARIEAGREIDWATASDHIPLTNPFLRRVFKEFREVLQENVTWATGTLINLLNKSDIEAILRPSKKAGFTKDPIFYFYEPFLSAYNPALREKRGVYYTPEPVVSYIVRSVDILLEEKFGLSDGLADKEKVREGIPQLLILDPATGTGTFLFEVLGQIYKRLKVEKFGNPNDDEVQKNILSRIFGFELMMAPYSIAHLKLGLFLKNHGYAFKEDKRLNIFLTNTLEPPSESPPSLGSIFNKALADEVTKASEVKKTKPIMVVLGNPPYSGHSANKDIEWISKLLNGVDTSEAGKTTANYFKVDGIGLGERNPKWLNDDYVRFIRWAQWKIEKTGSGILAFITNHGYLDNPTFRGMRQSLLETFDEIYVLDLHGNAKKKEASPDGGKDENVFDIQQGVAIGIFVKNQGKGTAKVFHADLYGLREIYENGDLVGGKYHWLFENALKTTDWKQLAPSKPFYMFVPQNKDLENEYKAWLSIVELMPTNSVGIVTARDELNINWSKDETFAKIKEFISLEVEQARDKFNLGNDVRDWKVTFAQEDVRKHGLDKDKIVEILYRPFDKRYTYYSRQSRGIICMPRPEVMQHMLAGPNLGLITSRDIEAERMWDQSLVTRKVISLHTLSIKEGNYLFPLYLYPDKDGNTLKLEMHVWPPGKDGRVPNFSKTVISKVESKLGLVFSPSPAVLAGEGRGEGKIERGKGKFFTPEDLFHYIYAVLHSRTYRTRYADFLKYDFPRIPFTSNVATFRKLAQKGEELASLHLLESKELDNTIASYPISGDDKVEKVRYDEANSRVFINDKQYFDCIPQNVWGFMVGGYQVAEKWLKDRKGRVLDHSDRVTYAKIVTALSKTIAVMDEIDKIIESTPGFWET